MARPTPTSPDRSNRSRVFTISVVLAVIVSVAGYIGFRSYIYGDDAPPIPVLDDLGG